MTLTVLVHSVRFLGLVGADSHHTEVHDFNHCSAMAIWPVLCSGFVAKRPKTRTAARGGELACTCVGVWSPDSAGCPEEGVGWVFRRKRLIHSFEQWREGLVRENWRGWSESHQFNFLESSAVITGTGRDSWGCRRHTGSLKATLSLSSNRVLYGCVCTRTRTRICVDFLQATCIEQISCAEAIFAQLQGSPRISCVTSQVKPAGGGKSQKGMKAHGVCLCVREGEPASSSSGRSRHQLPSLSS